MASPKKNKNTINKNDPNNKGENVKQNKMRDSEIVRNVKMLRLVKNIRFMRIGLMCFINADME